MLRLEHKVIIVIRSQKIDDLAPLALAAMFHQSSKIGPSTSEVVVYINDWDARLFRALLQLRDLARHRWRVTHQLVRFRENRGR